jgi:hypothetical protein
MSKKVLDQNNLGMDEDWAGNNAAFRLSSLWQGVHCEWFSCSHTVA